LGNGGLKLTYRRGGRGIQAGSPMLNVPLATKFRPAILATCKRPNPFESEVAIRQRG
jgi:hypothetical protein